jgi:glycosyltransferase involved in cell wall biosynthesis
MILSIIIPIYNTELEILERCFLSIQKICDLQYECLLIDDGSATSVAQYCEDYAKRHPAFVYYRKNNGGVSSARNMGILHATGKYVCFVDADDEIEASAYRKDILCGTEDVIFTDLIAICEGKKEKWSAFDKAGMLTYKEVIERMCVSTAINGPYCKFIRREFIVENQICFDESMVVAEDAVFAMRMLQRAPAVQYYDIVSYYYHLSCENSDSRFTKHAAKIVEDLKTAYDVAQKTLEGCCFTKKEKEVLMAAQRDQLVRNLFTAAIVGIELNVIKPDTKTKIQRIVVDITAGDTCGFSMGTKMKYMLLINWNCSILKFLALLRRLRIRNKGIG